MNFNEWFDKHLDNDKERRDIKTLVNHGADAGVYHIIYTNECVELYNRFEREIWEAMFEDAEEQGYSTPEQMLIGCKRSDMLSDYESSKTLKVWYMCERRAHQKYNEEELWLEE